MIIFLQSQKKNKSSVSSFLSNFVSSRNLKLGLVSRTYLFSKTSMAGFLSGSRDYRIEEAITLIHAAGRDWWLPLISCISGPKTVGLVQLANYSDNSGFGCAIPLIRATVLEYVLVFTMTRVCAISHIIVFFIANCRVVGGRKYPAMSEFCFIECNNAEFLD